MSSRLTFPGADLNTRDNAVAIMTRLMNLKRARVQDPITFITDHLGEHLWSKQVEIVESVRDNRHTAVRSCHGIGKSFTGARVVSWWIESHAPGEAFAVTTAPTNAQVRAILWREIRQAHRKGRLSGRVNPRTIVGRGRDAGHE